MSNKRKPIEVPAANRTVTSQDNMPPIERAKSLLDDLRIEAENWFDGKAIENEAQAAEVARLLDAARKAKKQFDDERKAEKKPHADAAAAVDAAWRPLTDDAGRIEECAKRASTVWLKKLDEKKRAEEAELARIAAEKAAAASSLAERNDGSFVMTMARDEAIDEAAQAARFAAHAAREKAHAKGEGMARSVALRTTYHAEIVDRRELLQHIMRTDPDGLEAFTLEWAQRQVRNGKRSIPGVNVREDRVAA